MVESPEPRGKNLLVGIFENAFKWMKLCPCPPGSPFPSCSAHSCLAEQLQLAAFGGVSCCKLNEACAFLSPSPPSHAYFFGHALRPSAQSSGRGCVKVCCLFVVRLSRFGLLFCICFWPRSRLTCIALAITAAEGVAQAATP